MLYCSTSLLEFALAATVSFTGTDQENEGFLSDSLVRVMVLQKDCVGRTVGFIKKESSALNGSLKGSSEVLIMVVLSSILALGHSIGLYHIISCMWSQLRKGLLPPFLYTVYMHSCYRTTRTK